MRYTLAAALLLMAACGRDPVSPGSLAGEWTLESVGGGLLPATRNDGSGAVITAGTLTIRSDETFILDLDIDLAGDVSSERYDGTFRVAGDRVFFSPVTVTIGSETVPFGGPAVDALVIGPTITMPFAQTMYNFRR
jgi:hypothetical protein